jgi:putative heme-binding domain-containing protein
VAFVGGSFGERMNLFGHFETLLHSRFPQQKLIVRNFCRPADEVGNRTKPNDYTQLDDPLYLFSPDTYLCFFGFNESFAGPDGIAEFKADYGRYLDEMATLYSRDETAAKPRFVLISPCAFENSADKHLPDGKAENANLKLYGQAVAALAKERGLAFVEIFAQTEALFAKEPGAQFTINGAHLSEAGDREVALLLDRALFGTPNPSAPGRTEFETLRAAVNDKSWVHLQDYRMLNGWYVYGGRRTLDYETFPREFNKIRKMVAVRDGVVWSLAEGQPATPDDSQTGELFTPPGGFGRKPAYEPKELKYLTPEESIATMKVPDGYEVKLFASEREFPELAKPDQINFDNKGRLWASCMPTYPQWRPGDPRPSDRLLIFEDTNADGKADKCTTFYDKLICPTGFEFWNGGVLVVDEPRLIWLKDTDGDDKADVVVHLLDGWATDDTHHTIGSFEYSPIGRLLMLEGLALTSTVETPRGPLRQSGSAGVYELDPRTLRIRHYKAPGCANPWCYVFTPWGQGILGDGTTPNQHWAAVYNGAFQPKKGLDTVVDGMGVRPNVGNEFIFSRHFPDDAQGLFLYACVANVRGLVTFRWGDDGAGFKGARRMKDGKPFDLLDGQDGSFRPADPQIGPDGALWFADWHAALLGHMQYSQRDPQRDHQHGRVYRLVAKDRPLVKPVTQAGKGEAALLEQLREYEPRTRYRAQRELRDRPTEKVLAAIQAWLPTIQADDKERDRLLVEALWAQAGQHATDLALALRILRCNTPDARAAAIKVISDELAWLPQGRVLTLLRIAAADDHPRVRFEAIRGCGFIENKESIETMLLAAAKPTDKWIDGILEANLFGLKSLWEPLYKAHALSVEGSRAEDVLKGILSNKKLAAGAETALKDLLGGKLVASQRQEAIRTLATVPGNADAGKVVFRRICIACHKFGAEGIDYGPPINGVGKRLKREDLVESLIEPNAKIDPRFVTTNVETNDGGAFTGFLASETADTLNLKVAGGVVMPIAKTNIKKRESLKQSSMPEGLASTMTPGEFIDLMEFLASLNR